MCQLVALTTICQPSLFMGPHSQMTQTKVSLEPKIVFPYRSDEGAFTRRDTQWQKCEQRRGEVSPFKGGTNKAVECPTVIAANG